MKKTVNLQLNLPENGDFFNVEHGNQNAVTLDGAVAGLQAGMAGQDQVISGMKTAIAGKADQAALAEHMAKAAVHVSDAERVKWNKAPVDLTSHTGNTTAHITDAERTKWNAKQDKMAVDSALSTTSLNPVQNKVITAKVNEINSNLNTVSFDPQADGLYANYKVGADTVRKKLGSTITYLGQGTSFDVSSNPNYNKFSENNFIVGFSSFHGNFLNEQGVNTTYPHNLNSPTTTISKSYNPITGILSIGGTSSSARHTPSGVIYVRAYVDICFAYLVEGDIN